MNILTRGQFLVGMFLNVVICQNAVADQLNGIKEFSDGTKALATEVNNNNLVLSDKAQELESRVELLENTSSRLVRTNQTSGRVGRAAIVADGAGPTSRSDGSQLVELQGGKLILEGIDCNQAPYALNRAYIENSRFSYIEFSIIGDCYGDLSRRTFGAAEFEPPAYVQEHAQVITLYPAEDPSSLGNPVEARIVPNPDSGMVGLSASFGGGLYIIGVDVVVGVNDFRGILFSRGAAGTLRDVTITMPGNGPAGIVVQHAANPYLADVTITGDPAAPYRMGIGLLNNAAVYSYGSYINIEHAGIGVQAVAGASLFSWAGTAMDINVSDAGNGFNSIWVDSAHIDLGNIRTNGDIWVREGGDLILGEVRLEEGAKVRVDSNGFLSMVPIDPENDSVLSSQQLDAVLNCNGLATVNVLDSRAYDGTASEIPNTVCLNNEGWNELRRLVLQPSSSQ